MQVQRYFKIKQYKNNDSYQETWMSTTDMMEWGMQIYKPLMLLGMDEMITNKSTKGQIETLHSY
jgi:hypothetical protein